MYEEAFIVYLDSYKWDFSGCQHATYDTKICNHEVEGVMDV